MEYLVFIGAIIAVLVVVKLLAWPIKKIIKLLINIAIGIVLLFTFNYFGELWFSGFMIPVNWVTALIVGVLGIPGFVGIVVYMLFF